MMTKKRSAGSFETIPTRHDELKHLLEHRRDVLLAAIHAAMRGVRADHSLNEHGGGLDDAEASVVDIQEDIELAVTQMKAETLVRVERALERLDGGAYGRCAACGDEIATQRLRAVPFAIRCLTCEQQEEALTRTVSGARTPALFWPASGPASHER